MPIRSVEFPALHATALEISSEIHMDTGHYAQAFPTVLSVHPRRDPHASPEFPTDTPSDACYWPRKHSASRCSFLIRMIHLLMSLGDPEDALV